MNIRTKFVYSWDEVPVLIDVSYACIILGVTDDTVQKLLRSGKLKGFKIDRSWRIRKKDLMNFVGESEEATA